MAHAVFRRMVETRGLTRRVFVDSAGTHDYHAGYPADRRAATLAQQRGYDMSNLRARQVQATDYALFDYIIAMDRDNLEALRKGCPPDQTGKLRLFMEFSNRFRGAEVPDPYYGNIKGFEVVLEMVEDGALGLLNHLLNRDLRARASGLHSV
jgi:low molecular weight protein-tyrosine phosphatase